MAPVIKWQRFEAAAYDWAGETATDALPQIEAELDAWITAVNGNASNTGRQVTKEKGYADAVESTSYKGFTISCGANSNTEKGSMIYMALNTLKRCWVGQWTDDGVSNNGYGSISTSGGGYGDTSIGWVGVNVNIDFIIMTDTTDGKEFFILGLNYANSTTMEGFAIWKAENGEWVMEFNDASNGGVLHYWTDATGPTGWNNGGRTSSNALTSMPSAGTEQFERRNFSASEFTNWDPVTYPSGGTVVAANEYLLNGSANMYGGRVYSWTDFSATDEVYKIYPYPYGPAVYVDVRP